MQPMNTEQIEFQLSELHDKKVTLVKPSFGKVSFSYVGTLSTTTHSQTHDIEFHFTSPLLAALFHVTDVEKLVDDISKETAKIIYLKGPFHPSLEESWRES